MLAEQVEWGGDRKSESRLQDVTLNNLGIAKIQPHRWQRLFDMPEEHLARYITECGEKKEP